MERFPRRGLPWQEVLRELWSLLRGLPNHFQNIVGSMTTYPHPLALVVWHMFVWLNANDIHTFRIVRMLEEDVISMLCELLRGKECGGMVTTGGTEANLAALYLAREHGYRKVYASPTAHDSIFKACRILGMELVKVPFTKDYKIDVDALEKLCRDHGEGIVVATVGTTGFGTIDDVETINEVCRSHGCVIHVDAAFGGFIAPFIYPHRRLWFDCENVVSVTIDPHKLGLVPIPCGCIVTRSREWFEPLVFEARYMPEGKQIGLLGTRSGASILATWAMLKHMGWEGYEKQARELMERTRRFVSLLRTLGLDVVIEPEVPIVCISVENDDHVLEELEKRGFYLYRCGLVRGVRVVVMPHVSQQMLENLARELVNLLNALRS